MRTLFRLAVPALMFIVAACGREEPPPPEAAALPFVEKPTPVPPGTVRLTYYTMDG